MVSFMDAPKLTAYENDPEYLRAVKASDALRARTKDGSIATRDERRLFKRYCAQMEAAVDTAREAHDAFLRENGLLNHE